MTPDASLVRAAVASSPEGVDRLVGAWLPTVLGWCVRLGGQDVVPEDAAQDVFELILHRLPSLRDPEAFPAWIYAITRKTIARHRRRAWLKRAVFGVDVEERASRGPDPQRVAEQGQTADRVWAALGRMSDHHREVLVLCDLEERSDSEVAALLGIPENTVKSRLRRGREALRAQVDELRQVALPEE